MARSQLATRLAVLATCLLWAKPTPSQTFAIGSAGSGQASLTRRESMTLGSWSAWSALAPSACASTKVDLTLPVTKERIPEVKKVLLQLADETGRGTTATPEQKQSMDSFALALASAEPSRPASAEMLSGTWNLVYTTEKEVLSLIGDPGVSVYQKLDSSAGTLGNSIVFTDGKRFDVSGTVSSGKQPEAAADGYPAGLRSSFRFVGAALTVNPSITVPLPPFGAGWFVSVYLDENLRVNRDSRGDLAIYFRA
mmetsp:Transcript_49246/g.101608  ORF Transcript_49246/g.101608 Transcript_49246/m.101608 type:complete len:253 (-) Transcript_49246:7-765(-)